MSIFKLLITSNVEEMINARFSSLAHFKNYVKELLEQRKEIIVPEVRRNNLQKTKSAVLFCLIVPKRNVKNGSINILDNVFLILEKRSKHMSKNPGDMAFPGGKHDLDDKDLFITATREAMEEIGMEQDKIEFIGCMDEYVSSSGLIVRSVVSWLEVDLPDNDIRKNIENRYYPRTSETDHTVVVPLAHCLNPDYYTSHEYIMDDNRTGYVRFINISKFLEDTNIWGLTASMIRRFIDIMFPENRLPEEPNLRI